MTVRFSSRGSGAVMALFFTLVLLAPALAAADPEPDRTVRLAFIGDRSGSAEPNRIPAFSESDLRTLAQIVLEHGGSMQGFVVGDATAQRPYIATRRRPVAPRCSRLRTACIEAIKAYRAQEDAWSQGYERQLRAFSTRIKELTATPTSGTSNVVENLRAALAFLNAPARNRQVMKVLILSTDMVQRPRTTARLPAIPQDVTTIWLNPQSINVPSAPNAELFTVPEEALLYLADVVAGWRVPAAATTVPAASKRASFRLEDR